MSRIAKRFSELRRRGEKALIPYIMAGDPSLDGTRDLILALDEAGADIIELGVPFSDPIADGPTIQKAAVRALRHGTSLRDILKMVAGLRERTAIPIVLMSYYNPVLKMGLERFAADASASGVDGLIIPDMVPEESSDLRRALKGKGVDLIFLIAPTSDEARIKKVAKRTSGFLYYVSLTGITGSAIADLSAVRARIDVVRRLTSKPVAVGFGISNREQAAAMADAADGIIVGSALVKVIEEAGRREDVVKKAAAFVADLKAGVRSAAGSKSG